MSKLFRYECKGIYVYFVLDENCCFIVGNNKKNIFNMLLLLIQLIRQRRHVCIYFVDLTINMIAKKSFQHIIITDLYDNKHMFSGQVTINILLLR